MHKYLFVESTVGGMCAKDNHREIIKSYAESGWKFVGSIVKTCYANGYITANDLVFEKEEKE